MARRELAVPKRIVVIDEIPVLGTGKTDYVALQTHGGERLRRRKRLSRQLRGVTL